MPTESPQVSSPKASTGALNEINLVDMTDEELTVYVSQVRAMRTSNQIALDLKPKGRAGTKKPSKAMSLLALLGDEEETEEPKP